MPTGLVTSRFNSFGETALDVSLGKHQMLLVVRSHMGEGVEEWVRLEGGLSLCCEQL